jgi:erythromycin esterase-like protein
MRVQSSGGLLKSPPLRPQCQQNPSTVLKRLLAPWRVRGDARFVLLGEAYHGTREFYHERARITQRLVEEKGFTAVAVEAD